jgi:integrase
MRAFATDPTKAHCYWLPILGLFTGARVNELCQLNPSTDLASEDGIPFLWITPETEGDTRIRKRTKNSRSRKLPIHSALIDLGFLAYVASVKARGFKLIFPEWKPNKGRASPKAEEWFRELSVSTDLRDETPGRCLLGMHAFRSTFMNKALNVGVRSESITGHAEEDKSRVVKGYEGALSVANTKLLLEQITFDVDFAVPVR